MLQSWMGSDFTNDDMVKESSLEEDYNAKLLSKRSNFATIELLPKENAAVVWGKIIITVDLKNAVPLKEIYYDDMMKKVRIMTFSKVEQHGSHKIPMVMELKPLDANKKKNRTKIILELKSSEETEKLWSYQFELQLEIIMSDRLELSLITKNKGSKLFVITQALHTYLLIQNISTVCVEGLNHKALPKPHRN